MGDRLAPGRVEIEVVADTVEIPEALAGRTRADLGDLRLDLRTRRCERAGGEVQLTAREFELLTYLMRHPGQVLSREQILNAVWGFDYEPGTNVLEVYVSYLRSKLGVEDSVAPIETVRGAGYRLAENGA